MNGLLRKPMALASRTPCFHTHGREPTARLRFSAGFGLDGLVSPDLRLNVAWAKVPFRGTTLSSSLRKTPNVCTLAASQSRAFGVKSGVKNENGGCDVLHSFLRASNACVEFKFKNSGGGAWESNPPSTRKLAEQPF